MKRFFADGRFVALVALIGLTGCSGSPLASVSPTAPSATADGSAIVGTMVDEIDPCVTSLSTSNTGEPPDNECPPPPPPPPPPVLKGRFTGGGFQIGAVKVTRGFTIHCDNTLTNNLEVNWGGGNNFHMDKESLRNVVCSRPVDPTPPAAPVSRITASSPGTCNGRPAAISFILEDHGEPGRNDRAQLIISGGCSLNLLLATLDGGNIQAHFDQPHKR